MINLSIHGVAHITVDHDPHYNTRGGLDFIVSTYSYYNKDETCIGTVTVYSSDSVPVTPTPASPHSNNR